jgi:hypothetical protein
MTYKCRKGANDPVIWMAAYENSPGLLGKIFKTSICLEKPSKPAVQKSIAKVSSVPFADIDRVF